MKDWFKYEYGYVNIDSQTLFLTNTGNWSEAKELEEKTSKNTTKKKVRRVRIIGYFIIASIIFLAGFLSNFTGSSISLLFLIGLPFAGYKLYKYLQHEMGIACKIPMNKLVSILIEEKNVKLKFSNGENEEDSITLRKVDEKGIEILERINREGIMDKPK